MFSTVATITGLIKFMSYGWHKGRQIHEVRIGKAQRRSCLSLASCEAIPEPTLERRDERKK